MSARDIEITRADVEVWVEQWRKKKNKDKPTIEDWIEQKLTEIDHGETVIMKAHFTEEPIEVRLADVIIDDLPSYLEEPPKEMPKGMGD